jgi:hypothetical protein
MFLGEFDDGRSKSFFCLAAALLPIDMLDRCREEIRTAVINSADKKRIAQLLKAKLNGAAGEAGIELKLRKK